MIYAETIIIIFIAIFVYFIIPQCWSIFFNYHWSLIRKVALKSSSYDTLSYKELAVNTSGFFKIYGEFDGLEDELSFCIGNDDMNLSVRDVKKNCFILPSPSGSHSSFGSRSRPVTLESMSPHEIERKTEGLMNSRVMAAGKIRNENGLFIMSPKLVVFYEGRDSRVFERIMDSSSPRYELFSLHNIFTFIFGIIIFLLLSYNRTFIDPFPKRVDIHISFTFAIMPLFFFFPPSILFLYMFRMQLKKMRWNLYKMYLCKMKRLNGNILKKLQIQRVYFKIISIFFISLTYAASFIVSYLIILLFNN